MAYNTPADEAARLAEVEAKIAKYKSQYDAIRELLQPLWSERKRLITSAKQREKRRKDAEHDRERAEYMAEMVQVGMECLALIAEEKPYLELMESRRLSDGTRASIGFALDGAIEHIWANPKHPLMPAALKHWSQHEVRPPTIDARMMSESEIADLATQFKAVGYTVKYENRAS
jgi:hypothetical protein